jgi:hypothetical protein
MKQRFLFLFLFLPLIFGSCSRWIAPPYTSVDKMLRLEKGMNPNQVNETLGIKPYNILHRNDSTAVLEFHYRLKDRDLNNITNYADFIHQEKSQVGGKNWFTKPSKFYLLYEGNTLSTLITENGLENSDYLLLKNNNLMLVSQSDLVDFKLWEDATYLHRIDDTQQLKAKKNIRHSIVYAAKIPYGAIGLKYAVGGKFGGYVSGAFSPDWGTVTYLTGGPLMKASPVINIYLGAGVGPVYYYDYYYGYDEFYMDSFVIEAGTLLYLKMISLDLGAGINFEEGLYINVGLGINF